MVMQKMFVAWLDLGEDDNQQQCVSIFLSGRGPEASVLPGISKIKAALSDSVALMTSAGQHGAAHAATRAAGTA